MERYKKANEGIHAPEELKKETAKGPAPAKRPPRAVWLGVVAAVLAVVIVAGAVLWPGGLFRHRTVERPDPLPGTPDYKGSGKAATLAAAQYPEMVPCPLDTDYVVAGVLDSDRYNGARRKWAESVNALASGRDYAGLLDGYLSATAKEFLAETGRENRVYSPLNLYLALAMLTETAGGNSRRQLLDLLGADSAETVRALARDLWLDSYRDDGQTASIPANSLWLNDAFDGRCLRETLDRLADDYYASAFSGAAGTPEYDQALRDWIDGQTHGLLKDYSKDLKLDSDTVLALVSTLYYQAKWADAFDPDLTAPGAFHAPGGDSSADFMHKELEGQYYWAERFGAVSLNFEDPGYRMWVLLPDEGTTPEELISSGAAMEFLTTDWDSAGGGYDGETGVTPYPWGGSKYADIRLTLPRFDISSGIDLRDGLKELGVTDVFDPDAADFTPLTDLPRTYVSKALHAARVIVEEEKVEAAAYTVLGAVTGAVPSLDDEVDFTVDRPFLFAVTGPAGLPLFLGVVNDPA